MANFTSNLDLISQSQAQKEVTANELFNAMSQAAQFGMRATTTSGLTWGYYGGNVMVGGVSTEKPNGTITLTNNATNYWMIDQAGNFVQNTSGPVAGNFMLYSITTVAGAVTTWTDYRPGIALSGSTALGSANQVLGVNNAGTTQEYKTITAGTNVTVTHGANSITIAASSGGVTNWTDSINTSAPNATVPVSIFTATNAASNVDAAVVPKGTGSFMLDVPDNLTAGGNKRGTQAIDLQLSRSNANQVASGNSSFVLGVNNRATNTSSGAVGVSNAATGSTSYCLGDTNTSSGTQSLCLGRSNTASGNGSVAIGNSNTSGTGDDSIAIGANNTASGSNSVAMGQQSQATAIGSSVLGVYSLANALYGFASGYNASTKLCIGSRAHASNSFTSPIARDGASQYRRMVLSRTAAGSILTLTTNNGAASTNNQLILANNEVVNFQGSVILKSSSNSGEVAGFDFQGTIMRGAGAGTTALVGAVVVSAARATASAVTAGYNINVTADTTNGGLKVDVTQTGSTNMKAVCVLQSSESL